MTDRSGGVRQARLVGVGVGPGDPDLLTVKAVRSVQAADLIFAPTRRAGGRSMALDVVAEYVDSKRQRVEIVPFPDTRTGESWDGAAQRILAALGEDRRGVFLTEGDPMLFGSFGRLMAALRSRRPALLIEIVPGVTSVTAAAAAAGLELTDYNGRLAIVPATASLAEVDDALQHFDCIVILKVGAVLGEVLRLLDRHNLLDQAVYVQRCGWSDQRIERDARKLLAEPPRDYFALLIVRRR